MIYYLLCRLCLSLVLGWLTGCWCCCYSSQSSNNNQLFTVTSTQAGQNIKTKCSSVVQVSWEGISLSILGVVIGNEYDAWSLMMVTASSLMRMIIVSKTDYLQFLSLKVCNSTSVVEYSSDGVNQWLAAMMSCWHWLIRTGRNIKTIWQQQLCLKFLVFSVQSLNHMWL